MSFSVLSKIVWARKLTFVVVFALIAVSATAFTLLVTPLFQSEALLMTTLDRAQRQQAQFPETLRYQLNSQIYIIDSEDVLRQAINEIGPEKLSPDQGKGAWPVSLLPTDLSFLPPELVPAASAIVNLFRPVNTGEGRSDADRALRKVKKHLAVNLEKDSQILSLTFRHPDPKIAKQFLGLVVQGFLQRQADLSGNAAAPAFFRQEVAQYRDEYKSASTELTDFAKKHSIYSVNQEIELALGRRDDTLAALAKTRGSILEKEAQAATYQNTVAQLRRRISLPGEVVGPKQNVPPGITTGSGSGTEALTEANRLPVHESPLLLVKVFQETAQQLVDLNSQIVGLRSLEKSQNDALSETERKLGELSGLSAEYRRLSDQVDQMSKVLEAHVGRVAEAQLNADWDASKKLSNVKVAQSATTPTEPVFPPKPLFIALGAVIGLIGGAGACVMLEAVSQRRREAYANRRASSDERSRDRRSPEEGERQGPDDGRFRDRWLPEPSSWLPAHGVADYRLRR